MMNRPLRRPGFALLGLLLGLAGGPAVASPLTLREAWVRATPPGAEVAAGYGQFRNATEQPLRVVGLESPAARIVEIHEVKEVEGVMRMRRVDPLQIDAGAPLTLAPGGLHVMLIGLKAPLREGDRVPLRLRLQPGGEQTFEIPVRAAAPVSP